MLTLSAEERQRLARFHEQVVGALAARFDVDASDAERRLSLGMRAASLLGAIALAAAAYTFVERFWWGLHAPAQVALLVAAPLLAVLGMVFAARRERTLYVTGVLGLVAVALFVVDLDALGAPFNLTPGPDAFLAWAVFAGLLAHAHGLRLLLLAACVGFTVFLSARVTQWMGGPWDRLVSRPESVLLPAAVLLAAGVVLPSQAGPALAPLYRLFGLAALLFSVFALSQGATSLLPWRPAATEVLYQVAFVLVAGLALRAGIRRGWPEVEAIATVFLVLFLLARFVDWCWDWMPRSLFSGRGSRPWASTAGRHPTRRAHESATGGCCRGPPSWCSSTTVPPGSGGSRPPGTGPRRRASVLARRAGSCRSTPGPTPSSCARATRTALVT